MRVVTYPKTCPECGNEVLRPKDYPRTDDGRPIAAVGSTHFACKTALLQPAECRYKEMLTGITKPGLLTEAIEHVVYRQEQD